MGREVRRVPAAWEHPKDARGHHVPLHGHSFRERVARWDEEAAQWALGNVRDYSVRDAVAYKPRDADITCDTYEEWDGQRPCEEDYMPEWPEAERTHLQMYETCSEGTPISPVMETPEALARWLTDNDASAFGPMTASYEDWLAVCRGGWAPSAAITKRGLVSGVELAGDAANPEVSR